MFPCFQHSHCYILGFYLNWLDKYLFYFSVKKLEMIIQEIPKNFEVKENKIILVSVVADGKTSDL